MQDRGPAELGEGADRLRAARDQHVGGSGHEACATQTRLAARAPRERGQIGIGRDAAQVEDDCRRGQLGQRGDGEPRCGALPCLPQVRQARALSQGACERGGIASGGRTGLPEDGQQQRVGTVVAEQEHRDAVGDAKAPREERAVALLELQQPCVDQRRTRQETRARRGAGQRDARELEREPDARAPAADVIVQVPVERLEACVQIGCERHDQQVDVGRHQAERPLHVPQPKRLALRLGGIGAGLDLRREGERLLVEGRRRLAAREQPIDVGLADVQPPEAVVRVLIPGAAQRHRGAHAPLEHRQAAAQVVERALIQGCHEAGWCGRAASRILPG